MLSKHTSYILVLLLTCFSCLSSAKSKGNFKKGKYYAPIGQVACKTSDQKKKFIREKFSKYGGVADIWNSGFPYRLDLHITTRTKDSTDFDYKDYFNAIGLNHHLKDFPKGKPVGNSYEFFNQKRVYFAAILYPSRSGGLRHAFETIPAHYKVLVLYKYGDAVYTISSQWPGVYNSTKVGNYENDEETLIQVANDLFSKCDFGAVYEPEIPFKQTLPESIDVKIHDQENYKNSFFRYVEFGGEGYSPGAFIAVLKNSSVKHINLIEANEEHQSCAAYISNKIKIKIYTLDQNNNPIKLNQKANKKACTYTNPMTQ